MNAEPLPNDFTGRKLVFVITEDWFFVSHFLPMAGAARELGFEVRGGLPGCGPQ